MNCNLCGAELSKNRRKYCSDQCRSKARAKHNDIPQKSKCDFCGIEYTKTRHRQKYCSGNCRRNEWGRLHPEQDMLLKKKWRLKSYPVFCRSCGEPVPTERRASGVVYCSDVCRSKRQRNLVQINTKKMHKKFADYKISCGCCFCGYNKFGGSLDFHHVEPQERERRIEATHWATRSELVQNELIKCILVCKNCHYELHHVYRENKKQYWSLVESHRIDLKAPASELHSILGARLQRPDLVDSSECE